MRRKILIGGVLSLVVLAFILYRLDLDALRHSLAGADYSYLVPLVLTVIAVEYVRVLQWRLILSPVKWVTTFRLFSATMVGYLANGLLFLRVSPLVRAYVVARRAKVSTSAVLATTVVDRLVDGFAFLGLVGVVLLALDLPPASASVQAGLRTGGLLTLALYLVLTAILVVMGRFPAQGEAVCRRGVAFVTPRWAHGAGALYTRFCQGICFPATWRDRVCIALYAAAKKGIIPFQVYWIALAFNLELPFTAYLFQVAFLGFIVFLAGSLGIRGTYQAGMIVALSFYGVSKEVALAIALIVEVVSHGAVMLFGLFFLWIEGITMEELRRLPARSTRQEPMSGESIKGDMAMQILKAAQQYLEEVTRVQGFLEKTTLKGIGLRQGDYTFVGTR